MTKDNRNLTPAEHVEKIGLFEEQQKVGIEETRKVIEYLDFQESMIKYFLDNNDKEKIEAIEKIMGHKFSTRLHSIGKLRKEFNSMIAEQEEILIGLAEWKIKFKAIVKLEKALNGCDDSE